MIKDMTVGKITRVLFMFTIPIVLGNIFQQFYNIVDSIIVGRYVGASALASVGVSYPITFVCITIANGASIGCGVIISQYFGSKDIKNTKASIFTALLSVLLAGIILTIIGLIFTNNILEFLNVPNDIYVNAYDYLKIYFYSIAFIFIYNIASACFNALGDSKTPLIFLIFSSGLNIVLDLYFIVPLNMGVRGAAIATLISQAISAVLSLGYLLSKISKMKTENQVYIDVQILKLMWKIAVPSILQQSIVSIGNLLMQCLVNRYGTSFIAGYTTAVKIDSISILPMASMSNAISTFSAQNIGANKFERVKAGYKYSLLMIAAFCIFIVCILSIFGRNIVGFFIAESDNEIINISLSYLKIVSRCYFLMGLMVITNGILRAAGDMKIFLLSTTTNLSTRVILGYAMAFIIGEQAIWYAVPLGWLFASIISVIRYRKGKWKSKKLLKE